MLCDGDRQFGNELSIVLLISDLVIKKCKITSISAGIDPVLALMSKQRVMGGRM